MIPAENPYMTATAKAMSRLDGVSLRASSPAELYDDWLIAETQASFALVAWYTATRAEKPAAYTRYVARTDAEQAAASRLPGSWPPPDRCAGRRGGCPSRRRARPTRPPPRRPPRARRASYG